MFLCCRIIYAGHGIEIHYQKGALPENTTYLSVPWTTEERSDMLPEVQLPDQCHFETDVYHIKESTSSVPLDCVDKGHVKTTVKLKEMSEENSQCLLFKAVVRYQNEWKLLDAVFRVCMINPYNYVFAFSCVNILLFCGVLIV